MIQFRIAVLTLSLLLVAAAFVRSAPSVGAAATGQIVGTVRLDGQAPHQRPIDMSKDPACAQAHGGAPVATENVGSMQTVDLQTLSFTSLRV